MKGQLVESALERLDEFPHQLAWYLTDTQAYYISESSVYRILKAHGLITSPPYTVLSAKDTFDQPITRSNQLWQTEFMYLCLSFWHPRVYIVLRRTSIISILAVQPTQQPSFACWQTQVCGLVRPSS